MPLPSLICTLCPLKVSEPELITASGNRTCIITLCPSDFKTQTSLTVLLRYYEFTNENVSYFLANQSKTKTFIDLKVTRKPKPTKNSTRPYLDEIPAHFIHEVKTKRYDVIGVYLFHFKLMRCHLKQKGYDVIGVNVFLRKLMKFRRKKKTVKHPSHTTVNKIL